jgi:N-acetylglutamate synthase-like GNAT family acetyltransferase
MKIRKASMADARAIQKVVSVLKLSDITWSDWHTMVVIRKAINDGAYYVAEVDGTIVGAMSLVRHRNMVEIGTLAVKRSCHGKGIGRKLVQFARFIGKRFSAKWITVSSLVAFGAKPFYLNVGFRMKSFGLYRGRKWYEFVAAL